MLISGTKSLKVSLICYVSKVARNADRRGGPAGPEPGARHMTGLVGEREL